MSTTVSTSSSSYTVSTTTIISLSISWTVPSCTKGSGSTSQLIYSSITTYGASSTFVGTPVIPLVMLALISVAADLWS